MPMAVGVAVTRLWLYGQFMCKITFYLQGVSVGASVFTITAMSIDRCLAIRHPMAFRKIFSRTTTLIVIALLWIVSIVIFLPLLWVRTLEVIEFQGYEYPYCYEQWVDSNRTIYDTVCFVLVYAVPGSVVIMCYSMMGRRLCAISPPFDGDSVDSMASTKQGRSLVRERRRVARILLLLAILFAMCWLPYNVMALVLEYYSDGENKGGDLTILNFSLLLGHANSAINPIIYCFMTRTFRSTVRELLMRSRTSLAARPHQRYKLRQSKGKSGRMRLPCSLQPGDQNVSHPLAFQLPFRYSSDPSATTSQRHVIKRLRLVPKSTQALLHAQYYPQRKSHPGPPSSHQPVYADSYGNHQLHRHQQSLSVSNHQPGQLPAPAAARGPSTV